MKFNINQAALDDAVAESMASLQAEYTAALQDVVREVRDEMEGQPVDEVYDELVRRLEEEIPGSQPNEPNLRIVAQEISDGTLTD